jgi:hypothetical protein
VTGMRVDIPIERVPGTSALYRDYVGRVDAPVHRRVGGFRADAGAWKRVLGPARAVDARVVARMLEENAALGVSEKTLERVRGLGDGRVRAVVTGQQPGVVGGPLLSLYKAATAVGVAREIEARWKTPCVPIFWLGSDDDDFGEIRELVMLSDALSVVSVSLDSSAHAPGRRVGDIEPSAVARVWDAVRSLVPAGETAGRVGEWIRGGGDFGRIAARAVVDLTAGDVAVIDGREPSLRLAARATLLAFFDREAEVRTLVRDEGTRLVADGYHAQLDTSTDSGLFWVRNGTRQRVPEEARASARTAFERDITVTSPGVVARNLMQDDVFSPVAVVLGPAEIAYRAQLCGVYTALGVAAPVVFPRLGATFVPPAVREASEQGGVDPALLATDPAAWVARVTASAQSPRAAAAARAFEEAFKSEAARFVAGASERLDARSREKLERRVAELSGRVAGIADGAVEQDARAGAAQWPWLARAAEMFVRDGVAQERFLSALVPYLFHGRDAWTMVNDIAERHARDGLDGRVLHRVYSR